MIGTKPTLNYAELVSLLSRIADKINDRPVGLRGLSDEDWLPLTVNHLLFGRTNSSWQTAEPDLETESYIAASKYQSELLRVWWCMWQKQVFPYLLPYQKFKDSRRCENLQPGDFCLLRYESKVRDSYRMCRVKLVHPSQDSLVRTVTVALQTKKSIGKKKTKLEEITVGVARLVLIKTIQEQMEVDDPEEAPEAVEGARETPRHVVKHSTNSTASNE